MPSRRNIDGSNAPDGPSVVFGMVTGLVPLPVVHMIVRSFETAPSKPVTGALAFVFTLAAVSAGTGISKRLRSHFPSYFGGFAAGALMSLAAIGAYERSNLLRVANSMPLYQSVGFPPQYMPRLR